MIGIFLQKKAYNWLKLLAGLVSLALFVAWVIHRYDIPWKYALVDAGLHVLFALIGLMVLENSFRYYLPSRSLTWQGLVLTFILTAGVVIIGQYALEYLFKSQLDYLDFLHQAVWVRSLLLMVLFGCFTLLVIYHARLEDQLKIMRMEDQVENMAKDAELYQLRQQLQPHFLFNSLNSINALIGRNPEKARKMVLQLSEFLRGTIRKDEKKWISVSEEMEYLQLFLNIEKIRFGERLKVDLKVDEEVERLDIPPLLIQPLLENAVKHGLNGSTGEVTVEMSLRKAESYLEVMLSNPYDPSVGHSRGLGFGLDAVTRRLYLLFGRHDLLKVSAKENVYTVWMKIPQFYDQDNNN